MTREKCYSILIASGLSLLTALGAAGCMLSAFRLELEHPAILAALCIGFSFLCCLLLSVRHGGKLLACLTAFAAGYLYREGTAPEQLKALIHRLSVIYNRAYGWGIPQFGGSIPEITFCDYPICILAVLIIFSICLCLLQQVSTWLPVLVTVLPLCSCIVVTDTVPEEHWLVMVLTGLILLMLTSALRRENKLQSLRLTAAAALPVILTLSGILLAFPQESYVNKSAILRENILIAVPNIPKLLDTGMTQLASAIQKQPANQVDLSIVGERIPFTYPVMDVTADKSGILYLREQDYDQYTGLGWVASEGRREVFSGIPGDTETLRIQTRSRRNTLYLPYHPADGILTDGFSENIQNASAYTVSRQLLPENWRMVAYYGDVPVPDSMAAFLELPEQTRLAACRYLEAPDLYSGSVSTIEKADIIAALVTGSAAYDLNTGKMPEGNADFAMWFLEESATGYCVHFATAAVVLLRAAGIPARYVTGYMLDARAGTTVTVTEENAHAWAEFYEPNLGLWLPLEATPADTVIVRPEPYHPAAPETTAPTPETTPEATETTAAAEPSLPAETTPPEVPAPPQESPAEPLRPRIPIGLWFGMAAFVLLLAGQRKIRLELRRRRRQAGSANARALQRWQELVVLFRLLNTQPPEDLLELTQKAKFSQHTLTEDELQQFDRCRLDCLQSLKEKPWYLQPVYLFLYAVY